MKNKYLIRTIREELGINQYEMALLSGVPRYKIKLMDQGILYPDSEEISKFSKIFKTKINDLEQTITKLEQTITKLEQTIKNFEQIIETLES